MPEERQAESQPSLEEKEKPSSLEQMVKASEGILNTLSEDAKAVKKEERSIFDGLQAKIESTKVSEVCKTLGESGATADICKNLK